MSVRRAFVCALGLTAVLAGPVPAQREPTMFICGIWPDRILFFDQTTDEFTEGLRLRHGAVTRTAFTSDKRYFFVVTDRMESVEVIDPVRREVIDELKLSTPEKLIRISSVFPSQDGAKVYLSVVVVNLEVDRFVREDDVDIMVYDREKREVTDQFSLPDDVTGGRRPTIHVAPDGNSLYVIGRDVVKLDAETREELDRLVLSEPLLAGYGAFRGLNLTETSPGIYWGIYRTRDPVQEKPFFGLAKLDLYDMDVSTFELGPQLKLSQLAIAPDGKRAYAGLNDMVVIDMEGQKVLLRKEGFERGRTNTSMIVSHDGTKLYISGVGDTVWVYDAKTLELVKTVFAGGDFMMPPVEISNPTTASSR